MSEKRLLSPDQAAVYLGLGSRWAIYRLIGSGELHAVRLLGKIRVDRADLNELIERKKDDAASDVGARRPGGTVVMSPPARLRRLAPVVRRRAQ